MQQKLRLSRQLQRRNKSLHSDIDTTTRNTAGLLLHFIKKEEQHMIPVSTNDNFPIVIAAVLVALSAIGLIAGILVSRKKKK